MKKLRRHVLDHQGYAAHCSAFPASQTSQQEPSLHDILVRYQNGLDISQECHANLVLAVKFEKRERRNNVPHNLDALKHVYVIFSFFKY